MKGSSYQECLVLIVVIGLAASISSAVPVPGDTTQVSARSKSLIDQLYGAATKSRSVKRASRPVIVATEPEFLDEK